MALSPGASFQVFVGIALLLMAAPVLLAARRRAEGVTLATFLLLVATNFLMLGLAGNPGPEARPWVQVAYLALALDPFYLLAFTTLYPFPRRPPVVRGLLALVAATSALSAVLVLARPEQVILAYYPADPLSLPHLLIILNLALAYLASWLLSLLALRDAPSPRLRERSQWLSLAVGVAVVPRLGLLGDDLAWNLATRFLGPSETRPPASRVLGPVLDGGGALALSLLVLLLGLWFVRRTLPATLADSGRRVLRLVLWATLLLGGARVGFGLLQEATGVDVGLGSLWSPRWLVFAAILVYGLLAYELVDFPRIADRALPVYGALLAALAGFLAVWAGAAALGEGVAMYLGIAVGLGAAAPGGLAARALARAYAAPAQPGIDRRLELYRAALEEAWAQGPPSANGRRRLERDRRAFGVSTQEARTLEHVVAAIGGAPPLRPGEEAAPGLVLGDLLGEGAHGRVYAARRYPEGDEVVVKELRAASDTGEAARQRLLQEVRALQKLSHPRIVPLLEARVDGGRHLLVLARARGKSLREVLEVGPLPEDRVAALAEDLLAALGAAHAAGIAHRDVKPSNILLDASGRALLTDFGVAVLLREGDAPAGTVAGLGGLDTLAGSLAYLAPEQARGQPGGAPSDLYAAALVLYECLTGKPALDVQGTPTLEALARAADPEVDLQLLPAAWRPVLRRALHPEARRRYASAQAMAEAVGALRRKHQP